MDSIEYLERCLKRLCEQRNEIMDNPFKYYNPLYWSKLKEIEKELERVEKDIYHIRLIVIFEEAGMPRVSVEEKDLYEDIQSAKETIKKYDEMLGRRIK